MAELFSEAKQNEGHTTGKFKNRNRMEIVANLLTIAKTGALKTHLMYRANLSYLMVTEYLNFLCGADLIKETLDEDGTSKLYQTTPKGLKYLEVYDSLQSIAGLDTRKHAAKGQDLFN